MVWAESRRTSPHQYSSARAERGLAISLPLERYAADGTQLLRRRHIRSASSQCGVGGMDCGTKECPEHHVLSAYPGRLRVVCAKTGLETISGSSKSVCRRPGFEAHVSNLALCASAPRLLAASTFPWLDRIRRNASAAD